MAKCQNWDVKAVAQPQTDGGLPQLKCNFLKEALPELPGSRGPEGHTRTAS